MDLVPYLSAVILIATIVTIVLALASYLAFKVRNRRKPKTSTERPVYFERYGARPAEPAGDES